MQERELRIRGNERMTSDRSDAGIAGQHPDRQCSMSYRHEKRAGGRGPKDSRQDSRNSRRNVAELSGPWAGVGRTPSKDLGPAVVRWG
jgi:hypothetical protein